MSRRERDKSVWRGYTVKETERERERVIRAKFHVIKIVSEDFMLLLKLCAEIFVFMPVTYRVSLTPVYPTCAHTHPAFEQFFNYSVLLLRLLLAILLTTRATTTMRTVSMRAKSVCSEKNGSNVDVDVNNIFTFVPFPTHSTKSKFDIQCINDTIEI